MLSTNVQTINNRLNICKQCPIYSPNRGICNPKLWLNPSTNEVSISNKEGYFRGCGCNVIIRSKNLNNHCIAGKW